MAGHDEIQGTLGEAPDQITLVESESDVAELTFSGATKLAYLTQTTLGVDETERIVGRLKARFPTIEGPAKSDICYATHNRQQAVRQLAKQADVVLVVGSQNSSNSRRLCEVAYDYGTSAHLLDDDGQLKMQWFRQDSVVGRYRRRQCARSFRASRSSVATETISRRRSHRGRRGRRASSVSLAPIRRSAIGHSLVT